MSTRRPKSVLDQDRYTAELSTGQLVIGVCILLMFGLGCFLLGVLIGKFDPTLQNRTAQQTEADRREPLAQEIKVSDLPQVTAPAPQANPPAADPAMPPEMRVPPNILKNEEQATAPAPSPAATNTPAAPAPDSSAAKVEVVPPAGTPPAGSSSTPAPAALTEDHGVSESVTAAAEKNRTAPPTAQPQAVAAAPAAQETPKASTDPAPSLTPWKGFGVQILAVAKDRAESARKDLEGKTSYKARVLPHARSDLFRVVVGPYAEQATAAKARDDLRARGFRDAFVLTLQ